MQSRWFIAIFVVVLVWAGTEFRAWSPAPYWPDAGGYTSHVAENRWVAHPPGYPFFVSLGHGFRVLGFEPYRSVQLASAVLVLAGVWLSFLLARPWCGTNRAALLAVGLAFSWITLLIAQTGTSHDGDLFTVALLLVAVLRFEGIVPNKPLFPHANAVLLGVALVLCAGFRFTTLLMMGPLLVWVAWRNKTRLAFWLTSLLAGAAVVGLQLWVIGEYGGYAAFSAASQSQHGTAIYSSILLVGMTETSLFNLFRTFLWLGLGGLPFFVALIAGGRSVGKAEMAPLLYGLLGFGGIAAGAGLYLCTHPGYVAGALPGLLLAASVVWGHGQRQKWLIPSGIVAGWLVFLTVQPFAVPLGKVKAVLNGVLLQYGAESSRRAVFFTTAEWLREGGLPGEIPRNRVRDLQEQDKRAQSR